MTKEHSIRRVEPQVEMKEHTSGQPPQMETDRPHGSYELLNVTFYFTSSSHMEERIESNEYSLRGPDECETIDGGGSWLHTTPRGRSRAAIG